MRKLYFILFGLLMYTNVIAQNGWVAYTTGTTNGSEIKFKDINTGIIVGGLHNYQLSTNSGLNWTNYQITSGSSWTSSIFFLNGNTYIGGGSDASGSVFGQFYISPNNINWNSFPASYPVNDLIAFDENNRILAMGGSTLFGSVGGVDALVNGVSYFLNDFTEYYRLSFPNQNTGYVLGFRWTDSSPAISKIIKTIDGGQNWEIVKLDTLSGFQVYSKMQFTDVNTGYVLQDSLYKTTDGGQNWFVPSTLSAGTKSFYFINTNIGWISGNLSGKIYQTTDGGINWTAQNIPVSNVSGNIYFINGQTGWAIANNTTILKTTTGGVTSIQSISSELPETYLLHQNYPNPFNPETKIKFEIPKQGFVSLKVYDIAGKEVSALFNGDLAPGVYEYSFDGVGLGSGIYFYTLKSENYSVTKKMILLK